MGPSFMPGGMSSIHRVLRDRVASVGLDGHPSARTTAMPSTDSRSGRNPTLLPAGARPFPSALEPGSVVTVLIQRVDAVQGTSR